MKKDEYVGVKININTIFSILIIFLIFFLLVNFIKSNAEYLNEFKELNESLESISSTLEDVKSENFELQNKISDLEEIIEESQIIRNY